MFEVSDAPIVSSDDPNALEKDDFIYTHQPSSPVVLESHKLVFFTVPLVGATTWEQLFRRMMGCDDWQTHPFKLPDDGLKYLYHYKLEDARRIMKEYTVAMMVREPKQRLFDVYQTYSGDYFVERCCPKAQSARTRCEMRSKMFTAWASDTHTCDLPKWRPQGYWMDPKFYQQLDYVLQFESAEHDAMELLTNIGAWRQYGSSGRGDGNTIFNNRSAEVVAGRENRRVMVNRFRAGL